MRQESGLNPTLSLNFMTSSFTAQPPLELPLIGFFGHIELSAKFKMNEEYTSMEEVDSFLMEKVSNLLLT